MRRRRIKSRKKPTVVYYIAGPPALASVLKRLMLELRIAAVGELIEHMLESCNASVKNDMSEFERCGTRVWAWRRGCTYVGKALKSMLPGGGQFARIPSGITEDGQRQFTLVRSLWKKREI